MKDKITYYTYMVLILGVLGGTLLGGIALIAWIMLTPPWHYIEKSSECWRMSQTASKATGVVCVLQGKVGEETTRQGRITYTKPVGDGVNSYKAIAILPMGATLAQERDYYFNMRSHCSSIASTPKYFPSTTEVELVSGSTQQWVDNSYAVVDINQ